MLMKLRSEDERSKKDHYFQIVFFCIIQINSIEFVSNYYFFNLIIALVVAYRPASCFQT